LPLGRCIGRAIAGRWQCRTAWAHLPVAWCYLGSDWWAQILSLDPQCLVCNICVTHVVLQQLSKHFKRKRFQQMNIKPLLASEMVVCPAVMIASVGYGVLYLHMVYDITHDIICDIINDITYLMQCHIFHMISYVISYIIMISCYVT
jgi:hypothetical protein